MKDFVKKEEVNLLPPPARRARVLWLYRKRFASINHRIIISILLIYAALGIVFAVTWQSKQEMGQVVDPGAEESQNLQDEVKATNRLITAFHQEFTRHQDWTSLVEGLVQVMPPQIELMALEVKEETQALEIRAVATSRTAVLDFQRIAEGLPGIERVEAPLKNFAVGVDGEFSLVLYPTAVPETPPAHE